MSAVKLGSANSCETGQNSLTIKPHKFYFLGTVKRASPRKNKWKASKNEDEVEEKDDSPKVSPTKNLDSKANHDISGKQIKSCL